jgi:hypothetical protein
MGTDMQNICTIFKVLCFLRGRDVQQQSEDTASAIMVTTKSTDVCHLKFGTEIEYKHTYKVCLQY